MAPKISNTTAKKARTAPRERVLGVTKDGVRILKPKKKATNFSARELRLAVAKARAARFSSD